MKKTLFLTMLAAVAVLAGCKKEESKGSATDRFEFREGIVTLAIGDSTRLTLVDDKKANDYVWTSSDPEVVEVLDDKGTVKAWADGEVEITVTSGSRTATCKVIAKEYMETLNFPLAMIWDIDVETLDSIPDTTVVRESGTYNCVYGIAEIYLCSEGLYWGNDGYLTGASEGVMMTVYAPVLYDSVQRIQFVLGDYEIVAQGDYDDELHTAPGGYYEEAYKYYSETAAKDYIAYYYYRDTTVVSEYSSALRYMAYCPYAPMDRYYYYEAETEEEESGYYNYYGYAPAGFAQSGEFSIESHESLKYMCTVTYANIEAAYFGGFYGWNWTDTEKPETADEVTLEWGGPVNVTYAHGTKPAAGVKELNVPVVKRDYPQVAAKMEKTMSAYKMHRK